MRWRTFLVDWPARVTEVLSTWVRLYFVIVFGVIAVVAPLMVLTTLVLWFAFGIRWGW